MTILVIAEHDQSGLKRSTFNTVTAAAMIATATGSDIHIVVVGHGVQAIAEEATSIAGVSKVFVADSPTQEGELAENVEATVIALSGGYTHILVPATAYGKNIAPRVAARLDVAQISDITSVISADMFERPIYAGNAVATVRSRDSVKVITVRTTAFDGASEEGGGAALEKINPTDSGFSSRIVSRQVIKQDRPDLASARRVVSGGRGLGSSENYARVLEPLADKLAAGLGASRAAVDAGFVPNDYQVGQTGKIVAPELYIAVGISGAIQHLAGMKDSGIVVAINKDPEAPIFTVADYGLVGDLFELVPELVEALHVSTPA